MVGAESGNAIVSGKEYVSTGYSLETADLWRRNLVVLLGFLVVFQFTQMLLIEYYPVGSLFKFLQSSGLTVL